VVYTASVVILMFLLLLAFITELSLPLFYKTQISL